MILGRGRTSHRSRICVNRQRTPVTLKTYGAREIRYLRQGGYVFTHVSLSVCLLTGLLDNC